MDAKARKNGLGRSLDTLIPLSDLGREVVRRIKLAEIVSNRYQPRHRFEEEKLKDLENSIRENGLIQPIIVRKLKDKFELVAGERRLLATKRLNLEEIPAIVKNVSDQKSLEIALIENIQRADLNPIEEAMGYKMLCDDFDLSHDLVSQKVGRSRSVVTNSIRLLKLPRKIQSSLIDETISVGHAKVILGLKNIDDQMKVYSQIKTKNLTVRETEKIVDCLGNNKKTKRAYTDPEMRRKCKLYAQVLRKNLDATIEIKCSEQAGKIIISFNTEKDLDRIVEKIGN